MSPSSNLHFCEKVNTCTHCTDQSVILCADYIKNNKNEYLKDMHYQFSRVEVFHSVDDLCWFCNGNSTLFDLIPLDSKSQLHIPLSELAR